MSHEIKSTTCVTRRKNLDYPQNIQFSPIFVGFYWIFSLIKLNLMCDNFSFFGTLISVFFGGKILNFVDEEIGLDLEKS
jgi:hypothetical protein